MLTKIKQLQTLRDSAFTVGNQAEVNRITEQMDALYLTLAGQSPATSAPNTNPPGSMKEWGSVMAEAAGREKAVEAENVLLRQQVAAMSQGPRAPARFTKEQLSGLTPEQVTTFVALRGQVQLPNADTGSPVFMIKSEAAAAVDAARILSEPDRAACARLGLSDDFAVALKMAAGREAIAAMMKGGEVVLTPVSGFTWRWYHTLGIGLVCTLVGVGGVIGYQKLFAEGVSARVEG